jgi:hypothetical protein
MGPRLSNVEFPFGMRGDLTLTVDSLGRIYVGDNFHSRIQRYSATGQFQLGWFVDADGIFVVRTNKDDRVEVALARREGLLTYATDGHLLSQVRDDDAYSRYSALPETSGQYKIDGWLFAHIDNTHTGQTVIAIPWTKRLVGTPFPSFAYSGLGVTLIGVSEWRRRRSGARLGAN